MSAFNEEYEVARLKTMGLNDTGLACASENAVDCLVDLEGQTYETVWNFMKTPEGHEKWGDYFLAGAEAMIAEGKHVD